MHKLKNIESILFAMGAELQGIDSSIGGGGGNKTKNIAGFYFSSFPIKCIGLKAYF